MTMATDLGGGGGGVALSSTVGAGGRYIVQVFVGALSHQYEALSVEASKQTTADEIVACIVERLSMSGSLQLGSSSAAELTSSSSSSAVTSSVPPGAAAVPVAPGGFELAEVMGDWALGRECKERRLGASERPVAVMLLWPKAEQHHYYRFYLREKLTEGWADGGFAMDPQLVRDYFYRFLYQQPQDREYPDLCQLPDLNERTLLDNLRARFHAGHIYTYVGSILIAVNPFKFHPIYNPKYVKLYQNRRLGPDLPPHIFAIADSAYHQMLRERRNQCVVISGESGSGKTESTNFLLHHLTALSQKGSHASGVEQTILSAGPVLEAFGNAKTAHNNNSSRFGKFIQVNYKENGMVHGAVVQKYLLEKSRICSQGRNERNYHVFYYLLAGASDSDRQLLHLRQINAYNYLNRSGCQQLDNVDENYEFSRLKQSMEMVGFTPEKQRRLFAVLSAVLLLGNVEFQPRKSTYHHDEAVAVRNQDQVLLISQLLRVKQETLLGALTAKRARASGETLVINYRLPEAIAARDAMAKCLYGALFDWIVLQVNHALLSKKDTLRDHQGNSIGVLDIFGFEDFGLCNSFEQLCINYANEHLQHYFNQHVFKYEQEEYWKEGIRWSDIQFLDNTACLQLIEGKPSGLLCLLDDQCNFPGASNETLLQKFNSVHKDNNFYEMPQKREPAFIVRHYAGKVKYQVAEMREKNLDLMRTEMVGVLKKSSMAFVRELVGADPVAVFRWAILRAFFRAHFAFHDAGRRLRQCRADGTKPSLIHNRIQNHIPNENVISHLVTISSVNLTINRIAYGGLHAPLTKASALRHHRPLAASGTAIGGDCSTNQRSLNNRLSWPQSAVTSSAAAPPPTTLAMTSSTSGAVTSSSPTSTSSASPPVRQMSSEQQSPRRALFPAEAKVIERATQIVMKNKSFRPRERGAGGKKGLKNLQSVKTLAGRTQLQWQQPSYTGAANAAAAGLVTSSGGAGGQGGGGKGRKQPLTVTAQFQHSLHSLMDTLNQANPFFIRCIKSNANKIANKFDDETVQRQLRYTGMLETVRIRQAGYNVRLSYDEFIQLYRILLPRGLLSSQNDVREFLLTLNLNRDNYQAGGSKIFLRECEKLKLDYRLHQQIVASIVAIQRWFRALLERRRFLRLRNAVVTLQSYWRMVVAQRCAAQLRMLQSAAIQVQAAWRGYRTQSWYHKLRHATIAFQSHCRGYIARHQFRTTLLHRMQEQSKAMQSDISAMDLDTKYADDHHIETMKRLKALAAHDVSAATEETREIRLGDPNKEILGVDTKKKQSPRRSVPKTYPDESSLINKVERKGSCDSLASQRSNDSQTSAPVRDTLYRAKKQIQALMGMVKKNDSPISPVAGGAHSDSEMDSGSSSGDAAVWMKRLPPDIMQMPSSPPVRIHPTRIPTTIIDYVIPTIDHISSSSNSPTSPTAQQQQQPKSTGSRRTNNPARRTEHLTRIPTTIIDYVTPTIDHISSSSNSPTSPTLQPPVARRTVSAEPTAPRRTSRRVLVQADSDAGGPTRVRSSHTQVPTSLDLKRRNSDPSSASPTLTSKRPAEPPDKLQQLQQQQQQLQQPVVVSPPSPLSLDMLDRKSTTMFTIAGHHFRKVARFAKDDRCRYCARPMDAFVAEGHKCTDCKQLFHFKCIQNGGVVQVPCRGTAQSSSAASRRKHRKRSSTAAASRHQAVVGGGGGGGVGVAMPIVGGGGHPAHHSSHHAQFSLTGTSEFTDRTDKIISDVRELQKMQDFITKKICKIESEESGKKPSQVDRVFKQALREFKDNLVATYSVVNKQDPEALNIKYKDLIANFLHVMETVCHEEQAKAEFPVTMGVNAFRGFLNEFMTLTREQADKPSKSKRKKEKKRKQEDPIVHAGHVFNIPIINIPTACEICTSFFMWPIERGLVCQNCKLTCHKKCYLKSAVECGAVVVGGAGAGAGAGSRGVHHVFGVPLRQLVASNGGDGGQVPVVVERLITTIEMYGLYTEGIYRKSGVSSKVRELKVRIEEDKIDDVQFEQYQVHVLTSVLKSFFREMPEPLLPFDRYDELLRAASLTEPQLRVSTLFAILNKLPKPNYDLMERLIFHLARVAQHEYVNRMNASALAIVFAPCILRTNKVLPAQDSLHDIGRQTRCIETIITEQLCKVRATLADIDTLDTACHTASSRLSSLRTSKIFSAEELQQGVAAAANNNGAGNGGRGGEGTPPRADGGETRGDERVGGGKAEEEEEEEMLLGQLEEIQKEKALLTSALPSLARASSDDDLLSTDDGSLDDVETTHPDNLQLMQPAAGQKSSGGRSCRKGGGGGGGSTAPSADSGADGNHTTNNNNNNSNNNALGDCDDEEDHPIMV